MQETQAVAHADSQAWTVRDVLAWTTGYLRRAGIESARFEAETLLAHALGVDRLALYLAPDRVLDEPERARYRDLIRRRRHGTPLAHLLEYVPFLDATLRVTDAVLIPRPETETLTAWIRDEEADRLGSPTRVLDLGTGSGAIAIALAQAWPTAKAIAVDRSPAALAVAQENARRNGVADRVAFVGSDWTTALTAEFELIVANPPYVADAEWADLPIEVRDHEPSMALHGGPNGTHELRRLIEDAPRVLAPQGRLYLEFGHDQAEAVRSAIRTTAGLGPATIRTDLRGRNRFARTEATG